MPDPVKCAVCEAINAPGVQFCEACGVELAPAAGGEGEIERFLEELVEIKPGEGPAEREALDLDREIVDELLDSLIVDEESGERFDCPLCGTKLDLDATACPKCGAVFAEVGTPKATRANEAVSKPWPAQPVPVSLTEDAPSLRAWSGRLIDFVVLGTILGLVAVFLAFRMYSWTTLGENPTSLVVFLGVAVGGMGTGFALFRVSTSAIARGDRLVKEGRYEDALYYYDRAIRMGSKPASAWTSKGVALKRLGRADEAMRCHNLALKLDPANEVAWCNTGDLFFRAGEFARAIECYEKAVEHRPRYAIAWNNKGAALARMGRFPEARRCHDEAVKLSPRYLAAWLNRGEVLARLGLREEAQRSLERARALGA